MARRKLQTMQFPPCCPGREEITYITANETCDIERDGWVMGLHSRDEPFYVLVYFCPFCGSKLPEGSPYESD